MRARRPGLALQKENIDLNGVILLSDILNWDLMPDDPELNPSIDVPYIVSLPTYAATAWYHKKLPNQPKDLRAVPRSGRAFRDHRLHARADAGQQPRARRRARPSPQKLHAFTGLPVAYLLKANLRIEYGAFQKEILADQDETTGTLDTRFAGPTMDPLSKIAHYDPQGAAIRSAYVSAWNAYVRSTLHYGGGKPYKPASMSMAAGTTSTSRPAPASR